MSYRQQDLTVMEALYFINDIEYHWLMCVQWTLQKHCQRDNAHKQNTTHEHFLSLFPFFVFLHFILPRNNTISQIQTSLFSTSSKESKNLSSLILLFL